MTARLDYPTLITLDTATPIAANRMQTDGADIRVYGDQAHTQSLPFYVENINAADTRLWVKTDHATGRYHTGIIQYYPLDSDGTDLVGGFTGTVSGGTAFSTAQIGQGADFNGTGGDDIEITAAAGNSLTGFDFSFECWIYPRSDGEGDNARIYDKRQAGGLFMCLVKAEAAGFLTVSAFADYSTTNAEADTEVVVPINNWTHVAITFNLATARFTIYLNGVSVTLATDTAGSGTQVDDTSKNAFIGNHSGGTREFDGIIDNLAIYRGRQLTADEIRSSYLRGLAGKRLSEPQPSAHWTMNSIDNAGSEVVDLVSGLNGAITGGVTVGQQGRVGQAFAFDRIDGHVTIPDNVLFEPHIGASGTSTWAATINVSDLGVSQNFISKTVGAGNQREFSCKIGADGSLASGVSNPDAAHRMARRSTVPVTFDTDVHVAVVYDATETGFDRIRFYIDGILVPSEDEVPPQGTFVSMTSGTAPVEIGGDGVNAGLFGSNLADLLWCGDALSAANIATLATRSKQGLRPDLTAAFLANTVSYWSLDNVDIGINPQNIATGATGSVTVGSAVQVGKTGPFGVGQAFQFDEDALSFVDTEQTRAKAASWTASLWFRQDAHISSNFPVLLSDGPGSGGAAFEVNIFGSTNPDSVGCDIYNNAGSLAGGVGTNPHQFLLGNWTHYVLVWNKTTELATAYLNGQAGTTPFDITGITGTGTRTVVLGQDGAISGVTRAFNGAISDYHMFEEALTNEQISDLYEKGKAGFSSSSSVSKVFVTYGNPSLSSASSKPTTFTREITGLVAAYEFDEDEGGTAAATVGTDGTLVGNATPIPSTFGNARKLEGDGVFDVAAAVIPTGNATISATIRTEAATGQTLLANYDGYADNSGSALEMTADGHVQFRNSTGSGTDNVLVTGSVSVNDGITHNILVTKNNSTASIYVDGVFDNSAAMSGADTAADTNLRIGSYRELSFVAPTGLILRVEADTISSGQLDVDGRVTDWTDQSPSLNNLSQLTAAERPVYQAKGIGGRPSLLFDQTNMHMDIASTISTTDHTIFLILEFPENILTSTTPVRHLIRSLGGGGNGQASITFGDNGLVTGNFVMHAFDGDDTGTNKDAAATFTIDSGQPYLFRAGLTGATEDLAQGGVSGAITENNGGLDSGTNWRMRNIDFIGGRDVSGTQSNCKFAAMLWFDNRLSDVDTEYVERYLALKYGTPLSHSVGDTRATVVFDDLRVFNRVLTGPEITDLGVGFGEVSGNSVLVRTRTDPDPEARKTGTVITGGNS